MENDIAQTNTVTEEWFLSQLNAPEIPIESLLGALKSVVEAGNKATADAWAGLLRDELAERADIYNALRVLELQAHWAGNTPEARANIAKGAVAILERSPEHRRLIEHVGFDQGRPAVECLRRLRLLLSLEPGLLCYDPTWGTGTIQRVDFFSARVHIDFERKPHHEMAFAYAAASLRLLSPEHLLARILTDRDGMLALARENPAEVVRMALRDLGPMTVAQIQELLIPRLLSGTEWKKFWEAARKALKEDARVEIPAKRTEPLRLHDRNVSKEERCFAKLAAERNLDSIIALAEEIMRERVTPDTEEQKRVLADRLAFVIRGATPRRPDLVAQALILSDYFKTDIQRQVSDLVAEFLKDESFVEITRLLPARWISPFMRLLARQNQAAFQEVALRRLRHLSLSALSEAVERLIEGGREQEVAAIFREAVGSQNIEVEFLYWLLRHPDRRQAWDAGSLPTLFRLILLDLARTYSGDRLKVQNQLRSRVEQPEFLREALAAMTPFQREEAFQLVRDCASWDALDRQTVLGHMIRLYPDLQRYLSTGSEPAHKTPARVTSLRSYRERQRRLEKLVTVDIPQNTREIAIARSYGDLSENHEYKAAKEMQGILLKRRGELESMLQTVVPTDFRDFPCATAGIGTSVTLRFEDGHIERYHILGEWDQDTERNIISSSSSLAKAIEGSSPGSRVRLPSELGERECTVESVEPLPPEIRAWISEEAGPAASSASPTP